MQSNIYNLKVKFNRGYEWDLDIEAINTESVNLWITKELDTDETYVTHVEITLKARNVAEVNPHFLARALPK